MEMVESMEKAIFVAKYASLTEEQQETVRKVIEEFSPSEGDVFDAIDEEINKVKGIADILWIVREAGTHEVDLGLKDLYEGFSFLFNTLWDTGRKLEKLSNQAYNFVLKDKQKEDNNK